MSEFLAAENEISISRGEFAPISLQVFDAANVIVNLTGGKVYFTMKMDSSDQTPLIQKSSDDINQIEITYPRLGKADIFINSSDTASLDTGIYIYDIWVILASGRKYPVIRPSIFEIKESITKFV